MQQRSPLVFHLPLALDADLCCLPRLSPSHVSHSQLSKAPCRKLEMLGCQTSSDMTWSTPTNVFPIALFPGGESCLGGWGCYKEHPAPPHLLQAHYSLGLLSLTHSEVLQVLLLSLKNVQCPCTVLPVSNYLPCHSAVILIAGSSKCPAAYNKRGTRLRLWAQLPPLFPSSASYHQQGWPLSSTWPLGAELGFWSPFSQQHRHGCRYIIGNNNSNKKDSFHSLQASFLLWNFPWVLSAKLFRCLHSTVRKRGLGSPFELDEHLSLLVIYQQSLFNHQQHLP